MNILFIHTLWLTLLVIVGMACLSMLILSIGLLIRSSRERKYFTKNTEKENYQNALDKTPNVIGVTRSIKRQSTPNKATVRQLDSAGEKKSTFAREIPSKELDHIFGDVEERKDPNSNPEEIEVDLQEEEADLQTFRITDDNEFASGVSFSELGKATLLLQKETLQPDEQKTVTAVAAKLVHTDLWEQVVNALPVANEKIAKMLDVPTRESTSDNDWQSFDIRNFI